jgi:hypothetical protein
MANTLKVKRSATYSATGNPSSLAYGEAAWNNGSSKLFIGKQTDGGGTVQAFHISSLADLTITGSTGLSGTLGSGNTDNTLTLAGVNATTSAKGVASFHSDNFSVSSGAVTIKNGGVILGTETTGNYVATGVAGTGISVSGATGNVTVTNTGVTSAVAGAGIDVSGATGAVTISIGTGEVVNAMIGDDEVNSEHYAAGSIDTAHIGDNQVTADKIADDVALAGNCSTVGNFTVGGNFIVSGDTVTLNTSTLTVEDIAIEVAKNSTNSGNSDGAGIHVGNWSGHPTFLYDDTGTQWELNKPLEVTGTLAVTSTSTFTGAITASAGFANTTFDGGTYS